MILLPNSIQLVHELDKVCELLEPKGSTWHTGSRNDGGSLGRAVARLIYCIVDHRAVCAVILKHIGVCEVVDDGDVVDGACPQVKPFRSSNILNDVVIPYFICAALIRIECARASGALTVDVVVMDNRAILRTKKVNTAAVVQHRFVVVDLTEVILANMIHRTRL